MKSTNNSQLKNQTDDLAYLIGVNVKIKRKTKGWSMEKLANEAGINRKTLTAIERGLTLPKNNTLKLIAEALGVSTADLGQRMFTAKKQYTLDFSDIENRYLLENHFRDYDKVFCKMMIEYHELASEEFRKRLDNK